ncbi:MAG: gamma-glutamylcyclotransferase [Clostridiales bacterium]|jgi:gamma-glutamylcyclotransferase (GGCT)/AIG2-like uncharacterized protein YtfP|nr:gamma-glutamylcyclotransferase [Clostridiales bacterium]
MNKRNTLYVAYGSNLNLAQMAKRCPTAKVVGASELVGKRLLFRGARGGAVATVEPYEGGRVPVLVWEITPADEAALDRYEGFPFLYRKEKVEVELDGKPVSAMVYIMNEEVPVGCYRPLGQPSVYYYSVILEGDRDADFDADLLRQATADSVEEDG